LRNGLKSSFATVSPKLKAHLKKWTYIKQAWFVLDFFRNSFEKNLKNGFNFQTGET
jgi:hypothetical protein